MSIRHWKAAFVGTAAAAAVTLPLLSGAASPAEPSAPSAKELANQCRLLDDPTKRGRMDAIELRLLIQCGRTSELGGVLAEMEAEGGREGGRAPGVDVLVNDPTGETGPTQTQSETSITMNEVTGTLCSGFNDSYSGVVQGLGYTGFARSTDGGVTFDDRGALSSQSFGDPSIVWRKLDGHFYFATIHSSGGMGIWRSTDDCTTFQFLALGHAGGSDDKELLTVDNNPASPFYGRLYMAWTNFSTGRIEVTHSDNGTNWTTPVGVSAVADVQGAWPTVAPDGTVYVGWLRWRPYFTGPIDIEITKSTNGGSSFALVTNPMSGKVNPYDSAPTNTQCGRPALKGAIRYLPSPQLAVSPNGNLHVVYSYDPDGRDTGDVVNVYYRRSTDQGATWQPEVQLNDDGTTRDQFFPTVSAGPSGRIVTTWYDRRADANNLRFSYFARVSDDGGTTWQPSELISDSDSPVYLDPNLATCYHGDYDQQFQTGSTGFIQWSDDRAVRSGHADPDTYADRDQFSPDFVLAPQQVSQSVCAPDPADYNIQVDSLVGFDDPVTLSASGNPPGTSANFSVNPVVPPGSSLLRIGNTGAGAPGTYAIEITGTAGPLTHSAEVSLSLSTDVPRRVALRAPADGAIDVPTSPTFLWRRSPQAETYTIEIARDPNFNNIVDTATVTGNTYTTPISLNPVTTYFWRVHAGNTCGDGASSRRFRFRTVNAICSNPGLQIPDSNQFGVNDSLTVSTNGPLTDLNVSLKVTHTYVGDLVFRLRHEETGTAVRLFNRPLGGDGNCDGDDINAQFDDEAGSPVDQECGSGVPSINGAFIPSAALSAFDGEDLSGTWTLNASDRAAQDLGTVDQWCLQPAQ